MESILLLVGYIAVTCLIAMSTARANKTSREFFVGSAGLGVAFVADWRIALLILGVFGLTVALTRYVSLGSCLAAVALPVSFGLLHRDRPWTVAAAVVIAVLAVFMHRGNLKRLAAGTERKISFRRKEDRT